MKDAQDIHKELTYTTLGLRPNYGTIRTKEETRRISKHLDLREIDKLQNIAKEFESDQSKQIADVTVSR